jgi:hypothetical protein
MTNRTTYHSAGKRGRWNVWQEGETQPVIQTRTKREAILKARALAQQRLARLLIHSESGTVSTYQTFERADEQSIHFGAMNKRSRGVGARE